MLKFNLLPQNFCDILISELDIFKFEEKYDFFHEITTFKQIVFIAVYLLN